MGVVGAVLLTVIATVLLLLCIPVRLVVHYQTAKRPIGQLRWLFFRINLLKAMEKKTKQEKHPAQKKKKPEKKKEKKPLEFSHSIGTVVDLLGSLKGGAAMIVRGFRIYRLRLTMVVAGEDAAETAVDYGKCNTIIYSSYALATHFLNLCNPDIDIRPDFVSEKSSVDFEMRGMLLPITVLIAALRIFVSFLVKTIQRKNLQEE